MAASHCITETSFSLGKKGTFLLVYKCVAVAGCKSFPSEDGGGGGAGRALLVEE